MKKPKPSNPWPLLITLMLLSLAAYFAYAKMASRPVPQIEEFIYKNGKWIQVTNR
jgi:hypothetical protein